MATPRVGDRNLESEGRFGLRALQLWVEGFTLDWSLKRCVLGRGARPMVWLGVWQSRIWGGRTCSPRRRAMVRWVVKQETTATPTVVEVEWMRRRRRREVDWGGLKFWCTWRWHSIILKLVKGHFCKFVPLINEFS